MHTFSARVGRRQQLWVLCILATAVTIAFKGLDLARSLLVAGLILDSFYLACVPVPHATKTLPEIYRWYRARGGAQGPVMKYVMYLSGILMIAGIAISVAQFVRTFP